MVISSFPNITVLSRLNFMLHLSVFLHRPFFLETLGIINIDSRRAAPLTEKLSAVLSEGLHVATDLTAG